MYNINPSKIARRALIKKSHEANKIKSKLNSTNGSEISINSILKQLHHKETGAKLLLRFDEWKSMGFKILKNSEAVRIWGKKKRSKQNFNDTSSYYDFYPMCCLFSEFQVYPLDNNPSTLELLLSKYNGDYYE